jgi:hypothetical protein
LYCMSFDLRLLITLFDIFKFLGEYWRMMEGYVSPWVHVIRKVARTNHQNYNRRIPSRSNIKRMTEISVWINQSMYIESILVFIVTSNLWVMGRCRETSCGNNRQMTIIIEYANIYYAKDKLKQYKLGGIRFHQLIEYR